MLNVIALIASLLVSFVPGQAADPISNYYAKETPYNDATSSDVTPPPAGYSMIFLETVGRHGARSLTNDDPEKVALKTWKKADEQNALTPLGKGFKDDVEAFQKVEKDIGYGNLSKLGKREWSGIGKRTATNYANFFDGLQSSQDKVEFEASPVYRTQQSADSMKASIEKAYPSLNVPSTVIDPGLVLPGGSSSTGRKAVDDILHQDDVRAAAFDVLKRLYKPDFVDNVLNGRVEKALAVYKLYITAAGMVDETDVTFADYVPQYDARVLAYANDASSFYLHGPGVEGEDVSYKMAQPLLDDFLSALDRRVAGGKTAAVFRLGHGETTMPFEALIKAPGSEVQAPADTGYTYADNPWRGDIAGLLGGNVEWTAYKNSAGKVLVTMRLNEEPVKFNSSCVPSQESPYFYTVLSLKTCLH